MSFRAKFAPSEPFYYAVNGSHRALDFTLKLGSAFGDKVWLAAPTTVFLCAASFTWLRFAHVVDVPPRGVPRLSRAQMISWNGLFDGHGDLLVAARTICNSCTLAKNERGMEPFFFFLSCVHVAHDTRLSIPA